jgi:hypothetical protein
MQAKELKIAEAALLKEKLELAELEEQRKIIEEQRKKVEFGFVLIFHFIFWCVCLLKVLFYPFIIFTGVFSFVNMQLPSEDDPSKFKMSW